MPASAEPKTVFSGVFRHSVDANRRVQMPFRWRGRKRLEFNLILWPQHDAGPCLRVLPPDEMEKLRQKVDAMPTAEKTAVKRHIGTYSTRIELDSANRIGIPEELAVQAGIGDQAVFAGMLDYFELWNPNTYAEMSALEKVTVKAAIKGLE